MGFDCIPAGTEDCLLIIGLLTASPGPLFSRWLQQACRLDTCEQETNTARADAHTKGPMREQRLGGGMIGMNWCTAGMSNKIVARAPSVPRLGKPGVGTNNMGSVRAQWCG